MTRTSLRRPLTLRLRWNYLRVWIERRPGIGIWPLYRKPYRWSSGDKFKPQFDLKTGWEETIREMQAAKKPNGLKKSFELSWNKDAHGWKSKYLISRRDHRVRREIRVNSCPDKEKPFIRTNSMHLTCKRYKLIRLITPLICFSHPPLRARTIPHRAGEWARDNPWYIRVICGEKTSFSTGMGASQWEGRFTYSNKSWIRWVLFEAQVIYFWYKDTFFDIL